MKDHASKRTNRLRNSRTLLNIIKASIIILATAVCLFLFDCSTEPGLDLISMNTIDLEKLLNKTPESTLKVDIFNELAYRHSWNGDKKPLDLAKSAKTLAEKLDYSNGLIDALCISGQIHFLNGNFDESKKLYKKALRGAQVFKYRIGEAMANNGIGRYHQIRGEFAAALENYLQSEEICKDSSNKIAKRVLARTYYGLGALYYYDPEDYLEAKRYFDRFLNLGKEINDVIIITSGYYTIGVIDQGLNNFEGARKKFKIYLELSKKIGLIYNQANANEGLGDMFLQRNCLYIALHYYNEAHRLFLETKNKFQIAEIKSRLGKLYNKLGEKESSTENYDKAFEYLKEALDIAFSAKLTKTIEGIYEQIIKTCQELGRYKDASDYYKLLVETKKFLRANEMESIGLMYESEKKAEKERMKRYWLIIGVIVLSLILGAVILNFILMMRRKKEIEIQSAKLERALMKEKQISDHKDDLMHTVSHQYKTPLSVIDSSAQILKHYLSKLSGSEIEEHVDKILLNLEKMTNLIDPLLKFGKKFEPGYYDLHSICRDFIEKFKPDEGVKHIIEFKSSKDCVNVKLDKDFMNIILNNLLSNSIKYSPEGSKISMELFCEKDFAVLKVRDNGIGIPSDYLNRPYERFHRGSNVKTVPGTGLGLSIVKRYTDLQSGDISIDSELNVGTTVTIRIPKN